MRNLATVAVCADEALFNPGLDDCKQTGIFQIRTGLFVGEFATLPGAGRMNSTTFTQPVACQENTGTVPPDFESVFVFQVPPANFTVAHAEMPCQAVDVVGIEIKGGTGQPVTTVAGTIVAIGFIAGQDVLCLRILHQRKFLDSMS